MTFVYDRIR
ncbi:Protein of unknown function [Pyronema omphalodes CBS 100304]|uniref:Uncharacterized protein n=1 Tax=Pyronema omphalodes (strain CBS 100304) TaxID=1076935 RepID=U4KUU0_PYROM|nr:Protein of unknown function [Pyronema omphalodes CBS 100304]